MEQTKVSVIIPVYNTEKYVRQAVESIMQQTLKNIEIIIVNDGSTDGSSTILQELLREDDRIKLFEQENQGQSVARNKGIKQALGKFLYFMDSDDVLEPTALDICYSKCEEYRLDFIFFDADILNKESAPNMGLRYNHSNSSSENQLYTGIEAIQSQIKHNEYTPSPCLNFICIEFLKEKELQFYPGIIHEDQLFTTQLYIQAQRVMYIKQRFFLRRLRENSTMTKHFTWHNIKGYLTVTNELIEYTSVKPEIVRSTVNALLRQMLNAVVWQAHTLPFLQRIRLFFICITKYNSYVEKRTLTVLIVKKIIQLA